MMTDLDCLYLHISTPISLYLHNICLESWFLKLIIVGEKIMNSSIDYTATTTQFKADVNKHLYFKKDNNNFINVLSVNQLNTLDNTSLLDIYLSTNHVIEPHYHQNAAELVYCISGSAIVSILNPFTKELSHHTLTPGQVANVPQGWWHYEVAKTDHTHLLAIFNASLLQVRHT